MKRIIYLASYKALHLNYDIVYQDINGKRDIAGDMLSVDLVNYDVLIATPPCNYWSRANYRRHTSVYSQRTKHLLKDILIKFIQYDKPFIVENVVNKKLMKQEGVFFLVDYDNVYYYEIGRHCYFTNLFIPDFDLKQMRDDLANFEKENVANLNKEKRQGGKQIHYVIEKFLDLVV